MKKTFNSKNDIKKIFLQLLWLLPGVVFYGLFRLAFLWPEVTETVYSRGIFYVVNQALSTATGILPFSLGELLLYSFALFVIIHIVVMIVRTIMAGRHWWYVLLRRLIALLGVASMVYALFIGLWGFNYARQPLSESLQLDAEPATVQELCSTCEALLNETNALRARLPEDENGLFSPTDSKQDMMDNVSSYYNLASEASGFNWLSGSFGPSKPVLYSEGLSYAHIKGVYFPFTGEANLNADAPILMYASSCCHEAAHQRGFAREDEANFLAYYVCSYSQDDSVKYSGAVLALIISMNALYAADDTLYFELREKYCDGLNKDLANNTEFWKYYESQVSEAAQDVNDTFLKANMQQDGVKSYGRMVDLLIALWRNGGI